MNNPENRSIRLNDEQEFKQVFEQFSKPIRYFAVSLICNQQDAEDIMMETFFKLWTLRDRFDNITNIKAFLYITTRNACFDYLKHNKVKSRHEKQIQTIAEQDESYADTMIVQTDLLSKVVDEISVLPGKCRAVAELSLVHDLKNDEIAYQLGITVNNVRVLKAKARQLLRSQLLRKKLIDVVVYISILNVCLFFNR